MKTYILLASLALFGATNATAQSSSDTAEPVATHECIMASDAAALTSLGLSPEQIVKVAEVQDVCQKECDTAMKERTIGTPDEMDKHVAQVKALLTPQQFTSWLEWCGKSPAKSELPIKK